MPLLTGAVFFLHSQHYSPKMQACTDLTEKLIAAGNSLTLFPKRRQDDFYTACPAQRGESCRSERSFTLFSNNYRRNYFLFEATSFSFQVKLFFFPHFNLTLNSAFVLKWRQNVAADERVVGYCWFLQVAI